MDIGDSGDSSTYTGPYEQCKTNDAFDDIFIYVYQTRLQPTGGATDE